MSDFLTRLAERTLGVVPVAQPVIAPLFAPGPTMLRARPELEVWDEVDETAAAPVQPTQRPASSPITPSAPSIARASLPQPPLAAVRPLHDGGSIQGEQPERHSPEALSQAAEPSSLNRGQGNLETPKIAYSQNRKRTIPDTVETNEEVLEPTPTVGEPFSEAYPSHRTAQQEVHMDVQRPSKPLVDMSLTEQQESITATELPQDIAIEADVVAGSASHPDSSSFARGEVRRRGQTKDLSRVESSEKDFPLVVQPTGGKASGHSISDLTENAGVSDESVGVQLIAPKKPSIIPQDPHSAGMSDESVEVQLIAPKKPSMMPQDPHNAGMSDESVGVQLIAPKKSPLTAQNPHAAPAISQKPQNTSSNSSLVSNIPVVPRTLSGSRQSQMSTQERDGLSTNQGMLVDNHRSQLSTREEDGFSTQGMPVKETGSREGQEIGSLLRQEVLVPVEQRQEMLPRRRRDGMVVDEQAIDEIDGWGHTAAAPQRNGQSSRQQGSTQGTETPPTIHVTIGRIDVRAVPTPAAPPRAVPNKSGPTLSLQDYLKQNKRGGS